MSEKLFQQALLEACENEFAEFGNGDEHRFSRRHKRKMKALFKEFSRRPKRKLPLKRRLIVVIIAILLASFMGVTAVAVGQKFGIFNISITHTTIGVTDTEGAPTKIEDIYRPALPEGYITFSYNANENWVEWRMADLNHFGGELLFDQYVKEDHQAVINNGNSGINFINVGEYEGYYVEFGYGQISMQWDHGDYVMSFFSTSDTMTVDDLIELALAIEIDPELEYGERTWDY